MKLTDIRLPDTRAWVALGLFALGWRALELVAERPQLASNQLFSMLAQALILTGVVAQVAAYYFGSSKGSSAKDETIAGLTRPAEAAPEPPAAPAAPFPEPSAPGA
jgi:hypothetical protein